MRQAARFLKALLLLVCLNLPLQIARGADDWRTEFDAACTQSNNAMSFTIPELTRLVERCDKLRAVIETQDETVRKVYLKRLQMCRNLYVFVLESKQREGK